MSREIDERVVQMRFDNAQFERETSRTMNTLQKLKASLNFTGVTKGFSNVASETNIIKKNMDVLQGGVNSVKREFSSLEVIGATCLVNLTNSAINAGKKITRALTIEPVSTGFNEYETKMNSIQTIMTNTASKGTKMEDVIKTIDELNTYADKTIYNFAEMTRNIGTFTAAGIGLEDSAMAIQGIANLAAASGSNSQQASTAMYQLSQALASGTVKLQDWNSVVNAGMGGELFQNALKETAREMGIAVDEIVENAGSFRESLSKGWITADVMNTTLRKFTKQGAKDYAKAMQESGNYTEAQTKALYDQANMMEDAATKVKTFTQLWDTLKETAQSGWGKTWELIVGNFDEAKNLFTELNDKFSPILDRISDARNKIIEGAMGSPSKWNEIIKIVNKAGITTAQFESDIKARMKELNINVDEQIEKFGSVQKFIEGSAIGNEILGTTIKRLTNLEYENMAATKGQVRSLEEWQNIVDRVWAGDFDVAPRRYDKLAEAGWEYMKVQNLVNKTVDGHRLTVEDLTEEQLVAAGATKEQAKRLKELSDAAKESGMSMEEMINSVNLKDGRVYLLQSLYNIIDAIGSVLKPIGQAFKETFSPITADNVFYFIYGMEKFTKSLILTEKEATTLKNVFKALFNVFDTVRFIAGTVLRTVFGVLRELFAGMNIDLGDLTDLLSKGTTAMREFVKEHDLATFVIAKIGPTLRSIGAFIDKWIQKLKGSENVTKDMGSAFGEGFDAIKTKTSEFFSGIWDIISKGMNQVFEDLGIKPIVDKLTGIYDSITQEVDGSITRGMEDNKVSFISILFTSLKTAFLAKMGEIGPLLQEAMTKVVGWFRDNVDPGMVIGGYFLMEMKESFDRIMDLAEMFSAPAQSLADMFDSVSGVFEEFQKNIKATRFTVNATGIFLIAGAIVALAGALYLIAKIPPASLSSAIGALMEIGLLVTVLMYVVSKTMVIDKESQMVNMGAVIGIVIALIGLCLVIKQLGTMDTSQMWQGIQGAGVCILMLIAVIGSLALMAKQLKGFDVRGVGGSMIGLGVALLAMIATVKIAGSMDKKTMKQGLEFVAMATLMLGILIDSTRVTGKGALGAGVFLIAAALTMGMLVGIVAMAAKISSKDLKQGLKVMAGITLIMGAMLLVSKIGGSLKAAGSLLGASTSMLIMIGVIKLVNSVSDEELKFGLKFIGAMTLIFVAFVASTEYAGENAAKAGLGLIGMAGAMLLMVVVMKAIEFLKPEKLAKGILVMSLFGVLVYLMNVSTEKSGDAMKNMLAFGALLLMLTAAFYVLYALSSDWKRYLLALGGLTLMMVGVISMIKYAGKIKQEDVKSIGKTFLLVTLMLGVAAGMILLMSAINPRNAVDNADALKTVMSGMGVVIFAIGNVAKNMGNLKKGDIGKLALIMLEVSALMAITALMLWGIEKLGIGPASTELLVQMSALMLVLSGCIAIISLVSQKANVKNMIGMVGVMLAMEVVMAGVIGILKLLTLIGSVDDAQTKILAVVELMGVLLVCALAISLLGNFAVNGAGILSATLVMAAMMVVMYGVVGIVAILAQITNMTDIYAKIGAVSILMGTLTICALAMSLLGQFAVNVAGIIASGVVLGAMIVTMYAVTGVIAILSTINSSEGLLTQVIGVSILLAALTICSVMMSTFSLFANPIGIMGAGEALKALVAVLPNIALVIGMMNGIDGENAYNNAMALSKVILALTVACAILSVVGAFAESAEKGVVVFKQLGLNIIDLIGVFIDDIGPKLDVFGDQLVKFSLDMMMFGLNMSMINQSAVDGCVLCAEMLTAIVGAAIFDKLLTKFGGESWTSGITQKLLEFADGVTQFSDKVSGAVDADAVNAAANAGTMMAELEKSMGTRPEWLTKLIGDNDMGKFGQRLSGFAEGINAFAETLSTTGDTINYDRVSDFCKAVEPIIELADSVPNEGGWLGQLVGENNIDEFAARLPGFAESFKGFADAIAEEGRNWDPKSFENFRDCVKPIIEIAHDIPNSGGYLADLIGDNDIEDFGNKLPAFAKGMSDFHTYVAGKTWESSTFENLRDCIEPIIEMSKKVNGEGGIVQWWNGEKDFGEFGTQLTYFGGGIANFAVSLAGASIFRSNNAKTMVENVGEMIDALPTKTKLSEFAGKIDFMVANTIPEKFVTLGGMMVSFSNSVQGVNANNIGNAVTNLNLITDCLLKMNGVNFTSVDEFAASLGTLGDDTITRFVTQFENGYSKMSAAVRNLLLQAEDAFKINIYLMYNQGKKVVDKIIEGMKDRENDIKSTATTIMRNVYNDLDVINSWMWDRGKWAGQGLADGLKFQNNVVWNAAWEMASQVAEAVNQRLGIASPSKLLRESGNWIGEGLALGMTDSMVTVHNAATQLGDETDKTLAAIIAETVEAFDNADLNPVIAPVLDLSDVNSGLRGINGMTTTVGVSRLNTIGLAADGASNDDILDALGRLDESIKNLEVNNTTINGITYDDGSAVSDAVRRLVDAALVARRS